ncbi:MAG: retropepsin-like aspartic protease family protein [Thalassotalea sp.]
MTQETSSNNLARYFSWLAWLIFLAAVAFAFDEFLTNKWQPNHEFETSKSNDYAKVILKQNPHGHYLTPGEINNQAVSFLLDTGATSVSIPQHIAEGLRLKKGRSYQVQTANGSVKVFQTSVSKLRIGEIILYNVPAHINPGFRSNEILLGMSALKQIEFRQQGKTLTLLQHLP